LIWKAWTIRSATLAFAAAIVSPLRFRMIRYFGATGI
jgi:hypothetical protein